MTPRPVDISEPRLTSLSHGGGCGCKIAPGVLETILRSVPALPVPPALLVGTETADDAAVYRLNERQAVVAGRAVTVLGDLGFYLAGIFFPKNGRTGFH